MREAVALNGDTAVLFCFASNLKKRLEVDKVAKPIFREAKFHFDFDAEGKIFVHQMDEAGHGAVSSDQQLETLHRGVHSSRNGLGSFQTVARAHGLLTNIPLVRIVHSSPTCVSSVVIRILVITR